VIALLVLAPLVAFVVVVLLGFAGCTLDRRGAPLGTAVTTYEDAVKSSNPIAYWRLVEEDAATGVPARDEIGAPPLGSHPGTFTGTGTELVPGQMSLNLSDQSVHSIFFDGGLVTVDVAGHPELAPQAFTFEALVVAEWSHSGGAPAAVRFVATSGDPAALTGWALYATDDDNWQGAVFDGMQQWVTPKEPISFDGKPTHLALTCDGVDALVLYVDGQEFKAANPVKFAPNTTDPIFIGVGLAGPPTVDPYTGRIQEAALYNVALTSDEIENHVLANVSE
jgi:Concanavalin A-like lectin/glucanases superfamily